MLRAAATGFCRADDSHCRMLTVGSGSLLVCHVARRREDFLQVVAAMCAPYLTLLTSNLPVSINRCKDLRFCPYSASLRSNRGSRLLAYVQVAACGLNYAACGVGMLSAQCKH
jgi:hypothetical protein